MAHWTPPAMRLLDPERDGPALHAILGDPESCRYLPRPALPSVEATTAQLRAWTLGWEDTSWATVDAADVATGRIALYQPERGAPIWEAACMIVPQARGQALARRALAVAIEATFTQKGARRVVADIDPDNHASVQTFVALGFRLEAHEVGTWTTHIGVRDSLIYVLDRDDPRPWR